MSASPAVPRRWLAFSAALLAAIMDLLDSTIAGVAAPSIRADLHGSYADLQWMAAAYTLAMAVFLLPGGRLGDLFGRRRMLLVGVTGFTVVSVVCASAQSVEMLIACRAAQGALGALMLPQVFGLIRDLFPPQEIGKAFGVLGPVCGIAAVLGPVVSGTLIDVDALGLGWRTIFLLNVPIAAYVLIIGIRHLPGASTDRTLKLDARGAALAGVAMFLLVFPLVQGRELGWPAWTFAMLGAAVPAVALFGAHLVRRARAGATPLIEPTIFRHRSYVSGIAFAVAFLASMGALVIVLGVLLQIGLGFSPLKAAVTTSAFGLGGFAGSAAGGMTMNKYGLRVVQAGVAIEALGLLVLAALLHGDVGMWTVAAPLLLAGVGMGMVWVPLFDIVQAGVADHELGSAAGVLQAVQQLGMTLGVAGVGTLFFGLLGARADHVADFLHAAQISTLVSVGLLLVAGALSLAMPRHARTAQPAAPRPEPRTPRELAVA
ncbi:MAG TPA: MFS transporter [Baekduia sp.]|nr:MFS transporter [Baekduia sp.]